MPRAPHYPNQFSWTAAPCSVINPKMGTAREFLEPSWSIQRAGCYELLRIVNYTGKAGTTTYDCLCLRCGARHVLERRFLIRIATSLEVRLGRKGIKYWLQVHGACPQCPSDRKYSPAQPRDCISKALFFCHALDAHGLRLQIFSSPSGTAVKIVGIKGDTAILEQSGNSRRSELAFCFRRDLGASCSVEEALRAFIKWANQGEFTLVRWSGGEFSLRYAGSFGGPGELRD